MLTYSSPKCSNFLCLAHIVTYLEVEKGCSLKLVLHNLIFLLGHINHCLLLGLKSIPIFRLSY